MASIPDAAHLIKLRKRLWDGRATILVGAGFSRSATTVVHGMKSPPLWNELAREMAKELYPSEPSAAPSDPLRLAEEYEKTLSRNVLRDLLAHVINDVAHEPGANHRALLKLPWSDVLTTNYDTLLERAALLSGIRYDVVRNPGSLPQAVPPRIIKLHGSFPDSYPLIITEEDYRRYEQTHGPFVSLARTRLVEHSLVMIGFSGDDPNFLRWSGWVRDHLPHDAPPLYLVTVGLSAPKRTLLEQRGIAPIDLAPAFQAVDWPDKDERHREAFAAFIAELERGKPEDPLLWPKARNQRPVPHIPLLPIQEEHDDETPARRLRKANTASDQVRGFNQDSRLIDLLIPWERQRQRYPGWVVAPLAVREALWQDMEQWHSAIFEGIQTVDAPNDLLLLREFAWRLDKAHIPVFGGQEVQVLIDVLGRYNPMPEDIQIPETENQESKIDKEEIAQKDHLVHTPHTQVDWDWSSLREAWVEGSFAVLRVCRDVGDVESFEMWSKALAPITRRQPEWIARLRYQEALMSLDQQEIQRAGEIAAVESQRWPRTLESFPIGEVWRSAILAEVGDLDTAETVAESSLKHLNEVLGKISSLAVQSQEGWARAALMTIRRGKTYLGIGEMKRDDDPPVWDGGEPVLGGDPYSRLNEVEVWIERPFPETKNQRQSHFDPGRITYSSSSSGPYPFYKHKHGISYFRVLEAGGVPFRVGGKSLDSKQVIRAAAWARPFIPWRSYAALLRSASKEVQDVFSRPRVAGIDNEQAASLFEVAFRGVEIAASSLINGDKKAQGRLIGLLGVLSRLSIRRSDLAIRLLEFAINLGQYAKKHRDWEWHRALRDVVSRTAKVIHDDDLAALVPKLFALPLPGRDLPTGGAMGRWLEPAEIIRRVSLDADSIGQGLVAKLLEALSGNIETPKGTDAAKEQGVAQARAALRLEYLYQCGGLTSEAVKRFSGIYWGLADDEKKVPVLPWLAPHFALFVPPPPSGLDAEERVRQALIKQDWGPKLDSVSLPGISGAFLEPLRGATRNPLSTTDEIGVDWTPSEAGVFVDRLAAYWDAAGQKYLQERENEVKHGVISLLGAAVLGEQLEIIPLIFSEVILTRLEKDDEVHYKVVARVVDEMSKAGFPVAVVYPALIRLGFDSEQAQAKIRKELVAVDHRSAEFGAEAVYTWTFFYQNGLVQVSPEPLIKELVHLVAAGRRIGLAGSAKVIARILNKFPSLLSHKLIERLKEGLVIIKAISSTPNVREAWLSPQLPELEFDEQNNLSAGANLARALYNWYEKNGYDVPDEVCEWERLAVENSLPEVRQAWGQDTAKCGGERKEGEDGEARK